MPLKRCPRSGLLYNSDDGPVHPDCLTAEEADYDQVLAHLRDNPHAAPSEVVAATGVELEVMTRMVEQGMIRALSDAEVVKQRKQLSEKELHRLGSKVAEEAAKIKLPDKKDVVIDGTVRNLIQQKRKI